MCLTSKVHVFRIVWRTRKVQKLVALKHQIVDCGAMLLRLGVAITSAVDEFIDHVVQPEKICERFEAFKVVPGEENGEKEKNEWREKKMRSQTAIEWGSRRNNEKKEETEMENV